MFDPNQFKEQFRENSEEIQAFLDAEKQSILQSHKLKILHSVHLVKFWESRPNRKLTFAIFFKTDDIDELDFEKINEALSKEIPDALKHSQIIELSTEFAILNSLKEEPDDAMLAKLSKKGNVVFYFGEEGIDVAIMGEVFDRINIFYDEKTRMKFKKKYHINDLSNCLKEYERNIREPGVNQIFFASKKLVEQFKPINPPKNTLHNKPESLLRDSLISFLNQNTQHHFSREVELNNKRELDLYTEVDTKKYLIEVKWLGQSINDDETGFNQAVSDGSARKGITQTLEYIKHLIEDMNYNLHVGYLCVFDARETVNPINYNGFNFIADELEPYYKNHFVKLNEVRLMRTT